MIYFDNSATTPLCAGAKQEMSRAIGNFGNPSSLHAAGQSAAQILNTARAQIGAALDARKDKFEIVFTSGGTEGNNLALFGVLNAKNYKNPKIITSDSEHPCVLEPCKVLEAQGVRVVRLRTVGGKLDEEQFDAEMDGDVCLVSLMHVNNETGAVYPVGRFFEKAKAKSPQVICHTDAVQAFLKIPLSMRSLGADLVTLSAHKIGGPKGCGALVISRDLIKRKALLPLLYGGGQMGNLRSGTENTVGIAGFGGAAEEKHASFAENAEKTARLRAYLAARLPDEVAVNDPPVHAPHILSLTLPNIKSETALNFFSARGICVSNGSACASNGKHKSYVLAAYGLTDKQVDSTIRVSLSAENTEKEVDEFVGALDEALGTLVRFK